MTTDIKSIYDSILELYNGYDQLTPLQKIEQDEKINSYVDKSFHQEIRKASLSNTPATIISIAPNKIKARANYDAESGEGFEDGYVATYGMLLVNYDIEFGDNHYEKVKLMHNWTMVEISGIINSIKVQRIYNKTISQNVWYSFWFDINLTLNSIELTKTKKIKASLIGASAPKNSSCFIATAAFGHNDKTEVLKLRQFRDKTLLKTNLGRSFIKVYKFISPPIADYIRTRPYLRKIVRLVIRKVVLPWI